MSGATNIFLAATIVSFFWNLAGGNSYLRILLAIGRELPRKMSMVVALLLIYPLFAAWLLAPWFGAYEIAGRFSPEIKAGLIVSLLPLLLGAFGAYLGIRPRIAQLHKVGIFLQ